MQSDDETSRRDILIAFLAELTLHGNIPGLLGVCMQNDVINPTQDSRPCEIQAK